MGVVVLPQGRVVPQGCGVPTPPKTPSPQLNAATAANGPVDASPATSINLTHEQGERLVRLLISGAFARSPRLDGESEEGHQQRVLQGLSGETGIAVDVLVAAAPRLREGNQASPLTNRGDGYVQSPLDLGDHFGTGMVDLGLVPGAQASTPDRVLASMGVVSNNPPFDTTTTTTIQQHPGSTSLEAAVPFIFSTAPTNATSSALTSGSDNAVNLDQLHLPDAPMAGPTVRGVEDPSQHVVPAAVVPAASASVSYAEPIDGASQPAQPPAGANSPLPGDDLSSIFGDSPIPHHNPDGTPFAVAMGQQGAGGSQDPIGSASAASAGWSLHVETATTAAPLHAAGQPFSQGVPAVAGISAQGVPSFDFVGAHAALHPQQQLNLPAPPAVSAPSDPSLAGLYDAIQRLQQLEAQSQPQPQPYPQPYLPGLVGGVAEGASGVASMEGDLMRNLTDQSRQGGVDQSDQSAQSDQSWTTSPTVGTALSATTSHNTRVTTPEGAAGAAQAASVNAPTFQAVRLPGASFHVAHYQAATVGQFGTINPAVVMPPPPMQPPSTSPAGIFDGSFDGNVQHFGPVSADPSEEELERVFQEVMGAAQAQAQQVQQAQQAQQAQQLQQGQQAGSAPFPPVDAPTVPSQAGPSRTARRTTTARQQAGPSRPRQSSSNATGSSSTRTGIVCDACRKKKVKCTWLPGAVTCVKCTGSCQDCVRRDEVVRRGPGIKTYGKAYYLQQIEGAEEKAFPQWWGSLTPKEQKSIAEEGKTIHDAQNPAGPTTAAATAAAATAALVSASTSATAADWSQSQRAPWTPRQQ